MDTGKLITLGVVGIGLYLLYEWLMSQCETTNSGLFGSSTCSMLLGTSSLPAVTTATSTTPTSTTPSSTLSSTPVSTAVITPTVSPTNTLTNLLLQAAQTAGIDPTQTNSDQWSTIYQGIPGKPAISGAQFESILTSLGLTDATRSTTVSASQFASALISNGLSGLDTGKIYSAGWVPSNAIHGGLYGF
jgi:hypothetical protein